MSCKITIVNPAIAARKVHDFLIDVSGTSEVIDVLMDAWMYANRSSDFLEIEPRCRENMFFVLKKTLKFIAEMEESIDVTWSK